MNEVRKTNSKEKEGYVGNMSPVLPTNFVIPERYQEGVYRIRKHHTELG